MFKRDLAVLLVIVAMLVSMAVACLSSYVQTRESRERYNSLPIAESAHAPRTPSTPRKPRILNINRTYSDIDGREVTNPTVTFADGTYVFGSVIVRQLRDDTWMVKIKPDDAKKSEMTVIVDVVTESATYFDLGPSPDNPGAIRS